MNLRLLKVLTTSYLVMSACLFSGPVFARPDYIEPNPKYIRVLAIALLKDSKFHENRIDFSADWIPEKTLESFGKTVEKCEIEKNRDDVLYPFYQTWQRTYLELYPNEKDAPRPYYRSIVGEPMIYFRDNILSEMQGYLNIKDNQRRMDSDRCEEGYIKYFHQKYYTPGSGTYYALKDIAECFRSHGDYDFSILAFPWMMAAAPFRIGYDAIASTCSPVYNSYVLAARKIRNNKYSPTLELISLLKELNQRLDFHQSVQSLSTSNAPDPSYIALVQSKSFLKLASALKVNPENYPKFINELLDESVHSDFFCKYSEEKFTPRTLQDISTGFLNSRSR